MSKMSRYAYLHTRVSGLSERLLSDTALEALVESNSGIEGPVLAAMGLPTSLADGVEDFAVLEQRTIGALLPDYQVLMRPLSGKHRDFLAYWLRRYELGNIKAIVRGRIAGLSSTAIQAQLRDLGPLASLPVEELLRTEDAAELLRRLEHSPYADIARQARAIYEERGDLLSLDSAVDKGYYLALDRRYRGLAQEDRGPLAPLMGVLLDRLNLVWLLRYRFSYDLAPAHAYYLLVPPGRWLGAQRLMDLVQMTSVEEVLRALPDSLAALMTGVTTVPQAEAALDRYVAQVAWEVLRRTSFNLARAFAYLVLRERNIRRLHAIFKGRGLHLPPALIRGAVGLGPLPHPG